jgi:hypothetical protein
VQNDYSPLVHFARCGKQRECHDLLGGRQISEPHFEASVLSEPLDKGWANFHRFFEMVFFMVHPGDEAYTNPDIPPTCCSLCCARLSF